MQIGARTTGGLVAVRVTSGGTGYSTTPSVTVAGGNGASCVAVMAGTVVDSVIITNAGTGYTSPTVAFSGGGGTGAAATAAAYTGALNPMSFYKGRRNELYGVDGMGRGIRWDGAASSVQPIGINRPTRAPAITVAATTGNGYVSAIQIVSPGNGYASPPTVTLSGGTPTKPAQARAQLSNGRVVGVTITEPGEGYQAPPNVTFSGGIAAGAVLGVGVVGRVAGVSVGAVGSGYTSSVTSAPTVQFSTAQGLTGAVASVSVDSNGRISGISVLSAGTGATTSGVTASIVGGGGTGATVSVELQYTVSSVTAITGGTGYSVAPVITFRADANDPSGSGAAATAFVNTTGAVTGASVYAGGSYRLPPTAAVLDTSASAQATISQALVGKYKCAIRYLDGTPDAAGGPSPSSISHLAEFDAGDGAAQITWAFTHGHLDARVQAMELWRTTGDQSVILFRIATIQRADAAFNGTYSDTLTDDQLTDTERAEYGVMPVTLPSGQLNARRFGVPPGNFAVACMFQDRCWMAVDTTGERPNSLLFSEVDEPESVPEENELVLQENTASPDKVVALIPLGGQLIVAQRMHLYALSYVAQPVIDASVLLVAYRGILNNRCWDVLGGVAFLVDSMGMYGFDGSREESVSVAVDNYWRENVIDFSRSSQFHLRADHATKTVRFYYCKAGDSAPVRALCYCVATKAWWEEEYASPVTATCVATLGAKQSVVSGLSNGALVKDAGLTDAGAPVPYVLRTGNGELTADKDRAISVLYQPTAGDSSLAVSLRYNNSSQARPNAIAGDRGEGFVATQGSTVATLNMSRTRSSLGDANGFARARYSGHLDDRSSGADRHVSVELSGEQAADPIAIYALKISGAQ